MGLQLGTRKSSKPKKIEPVSTLVAKLSYYLKVHGRGGQGEKIQSGTEKSGKYNFLDGNASLAFVQKISLFNLNNFQLPSNYIDPVVLYFSISVRYFETK